MKNRNKKRRSNIGCLSQAVVLYIIALALVFALLQDFGLGFWCCVTYAVLHVLFVEVIVHIKATFNLFHAIWLTVYAAAFIFCFLCPLIILIHRGLAWLLNFV